MSGCVPEVTHLHKIRVNLLYIRTFRTSFFNSPSSLSANIWRSLKMCSCLKSCAARSLSNGKCTILKTSFNTINTFNSDYRPLISQLNIRISVILCRGSACISMFLCRRSSCIKIAALHWLTHSLLVWTLMYEEPLSTFNEHKETHTLTLSQNWCCFPDSNCMWCLFFWAGLMDGFNVRHIVSNSVLSLSMVLKVSSM